jgi:ribosomal protein L7/L12
MELEEQVRLLAAGLGLRVADPSEAIPAEVIALARTGQQAEAVKALRSTTKLGLVEAKRIVDAASQAS